LRSVSPDGQSAAMARRRLLLATVMLYGQDKFMAAG
jgi:hypothetical protein